MPISVAHDDIDYSGLPEHMQLTARDYIERHVPPGPFLTAVLSNSLIGAYKAADSKNTAAMWSWANWLYNECPSNAWGSPEKVAAWIAEREGI